MLIAIVSVIALLLVLWYVQAWRRTFKRDILERAHAMTIDRFDHDVKFDIPSLPDCFDMAKELLRQEILTATVLDEFAHDEFFIAHHLYTHPETFQRAQNHVREAQAKEKEAEQWRAVERVKAERLKLAQGRARARIKQGKTLFGDDWNEWTRARHVGDIPVNSLRRNDDSMYICETVVSDLEEFKPPLVSRSGDSMTIVLETVDGNRDRMYSTKRSTDTIVISNGKRGRVYFV